jgi:hypothetical protein
MRTPPNLLLAIVAGATLSITSISAAQINSQWAAAVSDSWNVPARWSPVGVPGNSGPTTYNVTLPNFGSAYTVTLDTPRTVSQLNVLSTNTVGFRSALDLGANSLTSLGNFALTGGELRASTGRLNVSGTATFNNANVLGSDLEVDGDIQFAGSVAEEFCDTGFDHNGSSVNWSGECDIVFDQGTTFNHNNVNSVFTISHRNAHELTGTAAEVFNNFGTIIKNTGTNITTFRGVDFNNSGTVKVQTGQIKFVEGGLIGLIGGGTLGGAKFEVKDGAAMRMVNNSDVDIDIQTLNAEVVLDGATSSFASMNTLRTVAPAGKFSLLNGRTFNTADALINNGIVTIGNAAQLTINPSGSTSANFGRIDVRQNGQLTVRNGAIFGVTGTLQATGGTVVFESGATFLNAQTNTLTNGTFVADNGGVIRAPQLTNVQRIGSNVFITGAASDLQSAGGVSILPNISTISPLGTLSLNGRNVTFLNDFNVEGAGATEGRLIVGAGTVVQVAPGRVLTNFLDGVLDRGRFIVRGELVVDNLEITEIGSGVELDNDQGIFRNRTTGLDAFRSLRTLRASADVTVSNGRDLITIGNLDARPGSTLNVGQPVGQNRTTVRVAGDFNANGLIRLNGGEIITSGTLTLGGRLEGSGFINSRVVNAGVIAPGFSPGRTTVDGDFIQGALGELAMEIAGPIQGISYDSLLINGNFGFEGGGAAGLLSISLIDGFVPVDGQSFDLITYNRLVAGTFANITFAGLPSGASFNITYGIDRLTATYRVPAPGALGVLFAGGLLGLRRRRAR